MLVDRDAAITTFKKEKYYHVRLVLSGAEAASERISDKEEADALKTTCEASRAVCTSLVKEKKTAAPPKLFDLTSLQREANRLFGYTAKQTLDLAQALYEKRLLTYPRTDSAFLTDDMGDTAAGIIKLLCGKFSFMAGKDFTPELGKVLNSKKVSDHHAIIPTMELAKTDLAALPESERNILTLAGARLLMATAAPHTFEAVTAVFECAGQSFTARGKTVLSDGWKEIDRRYRAALKNKPETDDADSDTEKTLPPFTEGQTFENPAATVTEHDTTPPKPHNEASLLSAMERAGSEDTDPDAERKGLGTPATRAAVIEKLVKGGFVERKGKQLLPTKDGIGQRNEPEQFAILIDSRSRFETGEPGGVWLSMPTTKEQLHEAMRTVGITADNPQDFFINGYSDNENRHIALPYDMVCAADIDSLNLLAARIAQLDPAELPKLNAALQQKQGFENIGQIIDFTYNVDYFVHISGVNTSRDLGDYYLNKSGMVQMPEEWKNGVDLAAFGKNAAEQEQGSFTPYGYLVKSGDEWERHFEGRELPEEYRIMSYPKPEQSEQDKIFMDAAATEQTAPATAIEPQKPRPVIPIVLTSEKPAEKMKEITDRLEQGITELFDSERYKEYLKVMSRFHNYSFNNTLLIAMQKPDASLVAGFTAWKNNFQRNVIKGEKGIKIIAPSPFKVKQQTEKIDPHTRKPVMGKDGKPVMEEKEVTIPAYKVVSVFDVSQTEGKELSDIAVDELTGDVERYKDFFTALEKTSPVPIGFEKIIGGAHGYYHLEDKRIAIDEGMSELQTLKTAIHEIAHAKLHDIDLNAPKDEQQPRVDRRTREVEAESVAYTVCQHYGLDTSDYSFGYVAGWSSGRELAELKGSLETIRSTAAEIINSIDEHIAQIQKEQDKEQAAPAQEQPEQEAPQDKDTFSIYQIKGGDETRDLRFEPYDRLTATGHRVDAKNYTLVYSAELTPGTSLEDIYTRFNIDHPKDFKGHSLSVSDVVVLHQNGQDTAHYVDSFGYKDVPEFFKEQEKALIPDDLETGETIKTPRGTFYVTAMSREQMEAAGYGLHHQSDDGKYLIMGNGTRAFAVPVQPENYLKAAEQTTEQNYNMIDGQINNTPTTAELEAKVKAGETISLVDLAEAVKADKERGKAAKTEKKPSIRAQLRADKEKTAQKKAAKSKNHELEV